jgi:hypothetical protein
MDIVDRLSSKFTQCSPKVSPGDAIFFSILAANITYYGLLPKTLNLTPPELMKNAGWRFSSPVTAAGPSRIYTGFPFWSCDTLTTSFLSFN